MKKLLPLALALVLVLAACAKEDTPSPTEPTDIATTQDEATAPVSGTIPTETTTEAEDLGLELGLRTVEERYPMPQGEGTLMRISLLVPSDSGLEGVDAYYRQWLEDTVYYIGLERADLEAALAEGSVTPLPYEYEAGFNIPRNDGLVLSVSRYYYTFTGGVHGGTIYSSETFVAQSGALLTLNDLFTVAGDLYLPRLTAAVLEQIEGDGLADTLYEDYAQLIPQTLNPRSFYLSDKGLVLYWQTYDIAPYAAGPQFFEIPYGDLADIFNTQWLPL